MQSSQDVFDLLNDRSPAVAYEFVQPLAHLLTLLRERHDSDLEKALLMLTITLRSSGHPDFKGLSPPDIPGLEILPSLGTNIGSLADATGIPRETARRKVYELIEEGWVRRDGTTLHYTPEGYAAVSAERTALIAMYVRGHRAIGAVQRASPQGKPD